MTAQAIARSISRTVADLLNAGQFEARVLAIFKRVCDLITHDGEVVAVVLPQIGDGPLNIVVNEATDLFAGIGPGAKVTLDGDQLQIGRLGVELGEATVWEPRPEWDRLRARRAMIAPCVPLLRAICVRHAPAGSLLSLLSDRLPDDKLAGPVLSAARKATGILWDGLKGHPDKLKAGAMGLAGLGGGLTPAGDDFLTGAMLGAWLTHPTPHALCRALVEVAVPRTTMLSASFLQAAARGECSAQWHSLLAAMDDEPNSAVETRITAAVQKIMSHGATSGADSLVGFLLSFDALEEGAAAGRLRPSAVGTVRSRRRRGQASLILEG